jgi:ankyrin repeat protein
MKQENIFAAIRRGDASKLARALSSKNVDARDEDGRTPLMHAVLAERPNPEIIRLLAERGADLNAADKGGWTALHFAGQDQKAEAVRALLEAGAAVDPRDADGTTPLWRAVMSGSSKEVVRLLLEAGADPKAQDKWGSSSPLSLAEEMGEDEVTALMRASGR